MTPEPRREDYSNPADYGKAHARWTLENAYRKRAEREERRQMRLNAGVRAPRAYSTREGKRHISRHYPDWQLIASEHHTLHTTREGKRVTRRSDVTGLGDALYQTPEGLVYVQFGCVGSRSEHRKKFEAWGGADRLAELHARMLYIEVTPQGDVVREEWWHSESAP